MRWGRSHFRLTSSRCQRRRVWSKEVRKALTRRAEVLEDGKHESLFASRLRVGNLAAKNGELLTQDEQLEILRARGSTGEQDQAQYLAKGDQDKTGGHGRSLAAVTTSRRGSRNGRSVAGSSCGTLQVPRVNRQAVPILTYASVAEAGVTLDHRERGDPVHRRGGLDGAVAATVARVG